MLLSYVANFPHLDFLEKDIHKVIAPDLSIFDNASPKLKSVRLSITHLENEMKKKLGFVLDQNKVYLSDTTLTLKNGHYVLPVANAYKNKVKGIVQDVSGSGETTFIEPEVLVEMNNKMVELRNEEREEIRRLLAALSQEIASVAEPVLLNNKMIGYLDYLQAKALYADETKSHESRASVGIYLPRQGVSFAQDVIFSSNLLSQNTSELAITYRGTISQGESFISFSSGTPLCKLQDYPILGSPYTAIFKVSNFDISMPDSSSTYRIYRYFLFQGVSRAVCSDTVSLDYFGFTYTNVKASLSDYVYEKTTMVAEDPNESGRHIDNGDGDFFGRSITSVGLIALILFVPSATFGLGLLLGWVIFHQRRKKS